MTKPTTIKKIIIKRKKKEKKKKKKRNHSFETFFSGFPLAVIFICLVLSPYLVYLRIFPGGSDGRESTCEAGSLGLIAGLGRSPGGGHGNPLQYSCLENPMDRGAWQATVHGVTVRHTWATSQSTAHRTLLCVCSRIPQPRWILAKRPMARFDIPPLLTSRDLSSQEVSLTLRMRNIWCLIFYLGRA